jgi:hypothetical protein
MANITGSWCCHMPGEVINNNVSASLNYTMSRLGLDGSVFARWHAQPFAAAAGAHYPARGGALAVGFGGEGLAQPGVVDPLGVQAAAAATTAAAPMPETAAGGGGDGRDRDDPLIRIEGGGLHRNIE